MVERASHLQDGSTVQKGRSGGLAMGLILSPLAKQFGESGAASQSMNAKATEMAAGGESVGIRAPGVEAIGRYPRPRLTPEQKPQSAGSDESSAEVARSVVETQFDSVADGPPPDRVAAIPKKTLRERL